MNRGTVAATWATGEIIAREYQVLVDLWPQAKMGSAWHFELLVQSDQGEFLILERSEEVRYDPDRAENRWRVLRDLDRYRRKLEMLGWQPTEEHGRGWYSFRYRMRGRWHQSPSGSFGNIRGELRAKLVELLRARSAELSGSSSRPRHPSQVQMTQVSEAIVSPRSDRFSNSVQLSSELRDGLARHGIDPRAGMYQLMDEVFKRNWAFELWGAPWRDGSVRFTCKLFSRDSRAVGPTGAPKVRHLLDRVDSGSAWAAEESTPWAALARALVVTLDVLSDDS